VEKEEKESRALNYQRPSDIGDCSMRRKEKIVVAHVLINVKMPGIFR
jgi:hypothetical protein